MQTRESVTLDRTSFPEVNLRSVWGTMYIGGGAISLNEGCQFFLTSQRLARHISVAYCIVV